MTETTKATGEDVRKQLREALDEVEGLRDAVRVRAHLLGMELKEKWEHLDRRFLEVRDVARAARDDVRGDLIAASRDGLAEIKKGLRELRDGLDSKRH